MRLNPRVRNARALCRLGMASQQQVDCHASGKLHRHGDRRQRRRAHRRVEYVIAADDGEIVGHPYPECRQPAQHAERHQVVECDDGRRAGRQGQIGTQDAAGELRLERTVLAFGKNL